MILIKLYIIIVTIGLLITNFDYIKEDKPCRCYWCKKREIKSKCNELNNERIYRMF